MLIIEGQQIHVNHFFFQFQIKYMMIVYTPEIAMIQFDLETIPNCFDSLIFPHKKKKK